MSKPSLALVAAVLTSGCASLPFGPAPPTATDRLVAGPTLPPPSGLVNLCGRMPEVCAESAENRARATSAPALLLNAEADEQAPDRLNERMTRGRWRQLRTVNRHVNRAIAPALDTQSAGVTDYWDMPLSNRPRQRVVPLVQGDCEEFALEKRARLIALGWSPEALGLAVARVPQLGRHLVLIAQTDHGDYVLDNLHDEPVAVEDLDYDWLSRQAGLDLLRWAIARQTS